MVLIILKYKDIYLAEILPMFDGKLITSYDDVFQGHVHFELEDRLNNTNIHTLRGGWYGRI